MAAGDFYVRRNSADTTAVPNAGSNLDSDWDTVAIEQGSIVSYTDPNFQLDIGIYLVMYSEYFDTTNTTNNERIEIQGEIHVSGTGAVGGYGQGFIRKSSGDQECVVRGQMILDVTSDNTDVFIRFYRTDNSTSGTVNRVANNGGVIILELDSTDNFGLYSTSSSEATSGTTERTLNINTNDQQDTGFSRSGDTVTISNAGRYLATYSLDISQTATGREDVVGYLRRNASTAVVGSYSNCYLRGADGCQDGALTWIGIIDVSASDTFQVRWSCPTSQTITAASGATLQFWQIPSGGDEAIIEATTGDFNASGDFTWDTVPHIDTASFTATAGNTNVDVDQQDYILAFATCHNLAADSVRRAVPFFRIAVEDNINNYACADAYHRNSGGAGRIAPNVGTIVQTLANDSLELNIVPRAASGSVTNDTGQFSFLSLDSLFTYTFPPVITDFDTDEQFFWSDTNLVITGNNFEAVQGTGKVEMWDDVLGTTKVTQTIDSWSNTSIQIDPVQGGLGTNVTVYIVVTNDTGDENVPFAVQEGLLPYHELIVETLKADHYWRLNNVYDDTGDTGPVRDMTSGVVGTFTFTTTEIVDGNTHALEVDNVTDRREIADSPNMNITISSAERTLSAWIMLGGIQHSLGAIWKEGGGVQNLAFLVGYGNVLMWQLADVAGTRDNVQAWSDFKLNTNRPYHICGRYSHDEATAESRLYIDGVEQTDTDGNPMTLGIFDTHSGDVTWFDPDNNLETGGTDIAYAGQEDLTISDFATWSDNSAGTNAGALDKVTEIRDILFRRGALPDDIIATGTESAMQTALDATADSRPDWPLSYRIEAVTGGGDLELDFTEKTFDSRISAQIEYRGTSTLTVIAKDNIDSNLVWSVTGGTITIINEVDITLTVLDISDSSAIGSARVLLTVDTGGDLPYQESVTITRSGSTATVTHTAHGMITGQEVLIAGANQIEYNGIFTITVTGVNSYTYTVSGTPTTPATGTIESTTVLINGLTNGSGVISSVLRYTSDQPVTGYSRRGATGDEYKEQPIGGTVTSLGLTTTVFMIPDR